MKNCHFKRKIPLRIICDASKAGLGAVLQQEEKEGWKSISFASRFLTSLETKYSMDELELLAVVWALEQFRNYVYGTQFTVISDHEALTRLLKINKRIKTLTSRLTRWVDRLLPFDFEITEWSKKSTGIADYLSKYSSGMQGRTLKAESLWSNWFTVNAVENKVTNEKEVRKQEPIRNKKRRSDQIEKVMKPLVMADIMTTVNNISASSTTGELIKAMKKKNSTRRTCDHLSEFRQHTSSINSLNTPLHSLQLLQPTNPVRTKLPINSSAMQPERNRKNGENSVMRVEK